MQSLQGEVIRFDASDGGAIKDRFQRDKLLANCMAPQTLHLKLGAQVMLIKNMDEGLVNGSLGIVKEFMNEKTFEIMHPIENIGGSESVLSDGEEDDLNNQRKRQRLLALSAEGSGPGRKWPRVRFQLADGTYRDLLMSQESWKIELPNGEVQASRSQVPLILAWALSIHKAQGQTLERVKVDLGKVFEKGQAYVALSRATCQEGLQVLRFDPKKVMAHEKVKIFYDRLYDVGAPPRNGKQGLTGAVRKHGANGARGDAADSKRWNDDSEEDEPQDLPAVYDGYQ